MGQLGYIRISRVLCGAGLVVPEFCDDELPLIVREKFQEVTDCTNPTVRILGGIEVFRFNVNAYNLIFNGESKIKYRASARQVNWCETTPLTNARPVV